MKLADGLRSGEPKAQKQFRHKYWKRVYTICIRILGQGPDATDAAVDLMTDFTDRHVHHLSDPRAVWAYLRLMAVRQSLEIKKRRDRARALDPDVEDFSERTPESEAELNRLRPRLERCLEQLTEKAQKCLRLKYTEDLTNEQVEELGNVDVLLLPVGGVSTINAPVATEIVRQLEPKVVIPMHYKTPAINRQLEPVDRFLKEIGVHDISPQTKLSITKSGLPPSMQVILLEY